MRRDRARGRVKRWIAVMISALLFMQTVPAGMMSVFAQEVSAVGKEVVQKDSEKDEINLEEAVEAGEKESEEEAAETCEVEAAEVAVTESGDTETTTDIEIEKESEAATEIESSLDADAAETGESDVTAETENIADAEPAGTGEAEAAAEIKTAADSEAEEPAFEEESVSMEEPVLEEESVSVEESASEAEAVPVEDAVREESAVSEKTAAPEDEFISEEENTGDENTGDENIRDAAEEDYQIIEESGVDTVSAEAAGSALYSGTIGDNLSWMLDSDGTLTISGQGEMPDYIAGSSTNLIAPEYGYDEYRESIKKAVISQGVTSVGALAFRACTNLKTITLPSSVVKICQNAFLSSGLEEFVALGENVEISTMIFQNCKSLRSVTFQSIGTVSDLLSAFSGCSNLTDVEFQSGVVGPLCYNKTSIKNIRLGEGVTEIGENAFHGCTGITSITIPDTVTVIGGSAFYECSSLSDISFGRNVTTIGSNSFVNCTALSSIVFPDSVTKIGLNAFGGCSALEEAAFGKNVAAIESSAFHDCISLKEIRIPDSVTKIGTCAFLNCTALETVELGSGLSEIKEQAFRDCTSLRTMTFTGEAPSISLDSFYGDSFTAYYPILDNGQKKTAWYMTQGSNYSSVWVDDGYVDTGEITWVRYIGATITGTCNNSLNWSLNPDGLFTVSGTGEMEDWSMYLLTPWHDYAEFIQEIHIGQGVVNIGSNAFASCDKLETITVADSVSRIGESAFSACSSLLEITIPDAVSVIPANAFLDCDSLTKVVLPASLTGIGPAAFEDCSRLSDITMPAEIVEIGNSAFFRCTAIKTLDFPATLNYIGIEAFSGCGRLETVTIGSTDLTIETKAFENCLNIRTMRFKGNAPSFPALDDKTGTYPNLAFCGDTFTAYYPGENETWTTAVRRDYGGFVTWEQWGTDIASCTISLSNDSYVYNGTARKPAVTVTDNGKTLTAGKDYSVAYKNNTAAGTATVTVKGTGDYYGTGNKTFTITKAAQSITVTAASASIAVGKTTKVTVTGAKGTKSFKSSDTTIATVTAAGTVAAKKVGTVSIKVTSAATANYKAASKTVTIKIVPAATASITAANQAKGIKLTWKKVTGATGYKVYRGSTLLKTITGGSTVTYTDTAANKNGTKYIFKVYATASTGTGPVKSLVTYRVARPAISSAANSAAGKMTVKWGRNAKGTGYQIQYSTSKTFTSGKKAVSIAKNTTVSKVIGSLTKGKTYYVRIRTYKTVNSVKYWSAWSAMKTVKISK